MRGARRSCAGQLAYYGAFRTGRFAGRLIQPQNFPRPLIKDVNSFTRYLLRTKTPDADFVRCVWGKPLDAIATALRGCLVPATGSAFIVRDLSQIEARVIAWLAGQRDILDVFERGQEDIYVHVQKQFGLPSRQSGKTVVLGLGFGMGPRHFVEYAAGMGVTITPAESEEIVREWRLANARITSLLVSAGRRGQRPFFALGRSTAGQRSRSKRQPVHFVHGVHGAQRDVLLTMLLPSGRRLYYRNARLVYDPDKGRESIVYEGVDTYKKKWMDVGRGARNWPRTPRRPSRAM